MAKAEYQAQAGIELAALKKKGTGDVDLMRPGNGTPWEDRGTLGGVVAYFQTALKSLVSPGLLMDHIRRPETTGDANAFAVVCAVMWVIGAALWRVWYYRQVTASNSHYDVDPTHFWMTTGLICLLAAAGVWLWLKVGTSLYAKLAATEMRNATPSLTYNIFAYSLGPSILAVVPVFGQGLALLWIFIDLVVGGKKRLYMKSTSAFINALIIIICAVLIGAVFYYVAGVLIWQKALSMSGVELKTETTVTGTTVH
ncbi:MAG: hypothetical protein JWM97_2118 [Phycisphaerales bacterium]|jgi:hypothetical protein|nr:hypothetical protein [Phycisphaerales bacterium]MDB5304569.1 hypothetical protein [Phycisphaerales bacterium]